MELYDIRGQLIETLVNGTFSAGLFAQRVEGLRLSSGVYFYRLTVGASSQTRRMLFLK
jgi:hypothetical protein